MYSSVRPAFPTVMLLLVVAILAYTNNAWANECYAVGPNVLRVGSKEIVSVIIEGPPQDVTITLHDTSRRNNTLFTWKGKVISDEAKAVEVIVREDVLPDHLLNGTTKFYVLLKVQCDSQIPLETRLLVSPETGDYIFIQTDKPIYHPKSQVRFRLISLDERLRPLKKNITLQLRNPQGIVVEEHIVRPWDTPIFSRELQLPERTILGEWKLVALHGYKNSVNYTATFKVDKYVLPRFSVDVKTVKPYILEDTTATDVVATAKFVNNKNVRGYVTFRFGVKYGTKDIHWLGRSRQPKKLNKGQATFSLKKEDIRRNYTEPQWKALHTAHARLVVEANVTEEATGAKESGLSDHCFFSTSLYVISLDGNQRTFKPGVFVYILAKVTYLNGDPAAKVPLAISADRGIIKEADAETNEYGLASFAIQTQLGEGVVTAKVKTASRALPDVQQAKQIIRLQPYNAPRNEFIAIQRTDPKNPVKVGASYSPVVFANIKNKKMVAYYTVVSKGRVIFTKKLPERSFQNSLSFRVTDEMTPHFRVVAFAKVYDNTTNTVTLLGDSIYVSTERTCTSNSQTELIFEDKATAPGTTHTVKMRGREGTVVGLLGVDKALYLLHRGGLLTSDRVFAALESKDLGCGPGGGADTNEAISKSGIVVLSKYLPAASRNDVSCDERHRRKREAADSIAEQYKDPNLKKCCAYGLERDPFSNTCDTRVDHLIETLQSEKQADLDCIEAYKRCCLLIEEEDEGVVARNFGKIDEMYPDSQLGPVDERDVRKHFGDTWLFETVTIGTSGEATKQATIPESITTWELGAVSVSPFGGLCVSKPVEIVTFKEVFIEINLPYSVVEKEQVEVPVTVYNYGKRELQAKVFLQGTKDICSSAKEGEISPIQRVKVSPESGRTVVFPVVPLARGERFIQATAYSTSGSDTVRVPLRVEPQGKPAKRDLALLLDPLNERKRKRRSVVSQEYTDTMATDNKTQLVALYVPKLENAVSGTEKCELSIIGDKMGPALEIAINDPTHLVQVPTGCGEQTMIGLAPTLYTYSYLKASNTITHAIEDKSLDSMRRGYARILTYRQMNGGYAAWVHRKPSQWLTAFVVKNLCEAGKWIRVDESAVHSALSFLISKQVQDGSFVEDSPVIHTEMLGGVKNAVPMTAFVMIAFSECINDGVQVDKLNVSNARAAAYLERNLKESLDAYTVALAAYAFSISHHPSRSKVFGYLKRVTSYIEADNTRHIPSSTHSLTMEATSYALMTLINEGEDRGYIESFVNWMNENFRPTGASGSTQDTVVGLQALSKYAMYSKEDVMDLTCEVTISSDMHFNKTIRIRRDNSHIVNRIQIPHQPDEQVFLHVRGHGTANVLFTTTYHERPNEDNLCKFDLHVNFTELSAQETLEYRRQSPEKLTKLKKPYKMKVCARTPNARDTGMVNIDVGLLSGFTADQNDLDELQNRGIIDAYEISTRKIVFYLNSVPHDKEVCVEFHLARQYIVGNIQTSYVCIYSYYDMDTACTQFYSPDPHSYLVKTRCDDTGVCKCAEGGCPHENPLKQFLDDPQAGDKPREHAQQNSLLTEYACENSDFVWMGDIKLQTTTDGFHNIDFRVNITLKEGAEGDVTGKVRRLKIRDRCSYFKNLNETMYILIGEDSEIEEEIEGEEQFVYLLDRSSLLFRTEWKQRRKRRLVRWFVTEFKKHGKAPCSS